MGRLICVGVLASAAPVWGDGAASAESPQYKAWSKFKPGASATMVADVAMGQMKMKVTVTHTLTSVTDTEAKVALTTTTEMMGRTQPPKTQERTFPAKTTGEQQPKPTGNADVQAMGKTFACKVYEVSGAAMDMSGGHGGGAAAAAGAGTKVTIYVNDDVPGGVVKMTMDTPTGMTMNFVLTAFDAK